MNISKTRSKNLDTDTVALGLQVGSQMYQPLVRYMGDLSDGFYSIGLRFEPVNVAPSDVVAFTYMIVNSGYDASNEGTVKFVTNTISDVAASVTNGYVPFLGTLGNYLMHQLHDIFYSNCDGVVAADKIYPRLSSVFGAPTPAPVPGQPIPQLTGFELWLMTAQGGTYRDTRRYPGENSAVGCGENSLYFVTYSIKRL